MSSWALTLIATIPLRAQDNLIPIRQKPQEPPAVQRIRPSSDNGGFDEFAPPSHPRDEDLENLPIGIPEKPIGDLTSNLEVIIQRYPDGEIQIKRHVVQDAHGNYLNHGLWQLFNKQGQTVADGNFNRGQMHGRWQRWHPADSKGIFDESPFDQYRGPFLSVAQFDAGQLHGLWSIYDKQGKTIAEIPYHQGQRHGIAVWFWLDGKRMREISFHYGKLDGNLIQWDRQSTENRREEFRNGRRVTVDVTQWRKEQKKSEDQFLDRQLVTVEPDDWWEAAPAQYETHGQRIQHGVSLAWYENGQPRMRGYYENDLRHGWLTGWHTNGHKEVGGLFQTGNKEGEWIWWHANGMKSIQGTYQADQPVGIWTWWDENGHQMRQENFTQMPPPADFYLPDPTELPPPQSKPAEQQTDEIQLHAPGDQVTNVGDQSGIR